jgi:hypothetical protein
MPDGQGGNSILKALFDVGFGYVWFALLALWGGTVSYISRVRRNNAPFSFVELIGEWTISAFAGIMTALICQELEFSLILTAALAGISGHMGGRAIYMLEQLVCKKMGLPMTNRRYDDEPRNKD